MLGLPAERDNGEIFLDLLVAALQREERDLAGLNFDQPERKPSSVCDIGEVYIHNLLLKEAMRRTGVDSPYLEWEHPYDGSRCKCDICFVHYVDGMAVPYAAFEIKGPWDSNYPLVYNLRSKVRADRSEEHTSELQS